MGTLASTNNTDELRLLVSSALSAKNDETSIYLIDILILMNSTVHNSVELGYSVLHNIGWTY